MAPGSSWTATGSPPEEETPCPGVVNFAIEYSKGTHPEIYPGRFNI